jgi:LacI family transcriptional regulator
MAKKRKDVTIKDIAKKARVAYSTASLALNNKGYVSDKLKKRVLRAAGDLGYEPNLVARGLVSRKLPIIAAVFPENPYFFTVSYFLRIIAGIQEVCKRSGNALMLFNLDQTKGESYHQISRKWLTNQIIIVNIDYTRDIQKDIQVLKENNISFVLMNKYLGKEKVSFVAVDNYLGVYQALEHLVSLGHDQIGLINGNLKTPDGQERFTAFKKILKKFKLKYNPAYLYAGNFDFASGEKAALQFLEQKKKPTAVFAASDDMAIGFMRTLESKGYSIPGELSVVGFDDTLEAGYITPRLTTIRQPLVEMGQEAAGLVIEQADEDVFKPKHITLKPQLIIRESTAKKA